jgi:hypothetical protein
MNADSCPGEEELYAVLAGEGSGSASTHIATCDVCQSQLRKLQSEATILLHVGEKSLQPTANSAVAFPGTIGKFIVVGIWGDGPQFITYRALHAIVRQDVLIQVAKLPLCRSSAYQETFRTACVRWMQPRPHVARVLDAGEFDSRPYVVIEFSDGVRLDRLAGDQRLDGTTLMRIFGQIARSLTADEKRPHPSLGLSSIVLDDANQPTLIDWAAAAEFNSSDVLDASTNTTSKRLAVAFCQAALPDGQSATFPASGVTSTKLIADLRSQNVSDSAAATIAKAVTESGSAPQLAELARVLLPSPPRNLWQRLKASVGRQPNGE